MNKRLIFILMFFFALLSPLILNGSSFVYHALAVAPTPFGPGPVVPPGGGGTGGTTLPVQTPVAGQAFSGWNGTSFDTVTLPTPAPTVPASTPVAGQAVTGFGAGVSSVSRESFQAPLPTATPVANEVLRGWNGTSFDASQLDYSELANPPTLDFDPAGTAAALITSSTSDPDASCTGKQGNIWDKVDASGTLLDAFQCTCEGADNATNCVYKSIYNEIGAGLLLSSGTLVVDSTQADFLTSGALTCGAGTQGKMQVHTTPLQYCDSAATPTLRYAAYGDSAGKASSSATADAFTGARTMCKSLELLKDSDDGIPVFSFSANSTITQAWCSCTGTCASTLAALQLYQKDGSTALTGGNPTCSAVTATPTPSSVTANNAISAYDAVRLSVTNTPTNNGLDTYMICVTYTVP